MKMHFLIATTLSIVTLFAAGEFSGRRAPGFSLPDSSRKQYDPQDFRGKVLVIDFMQTACPHCAKFAGILEDARARYGDKIAILSIVNPPSNQSTVAQFIAENKVKSPILFDCGQVTYSYLNSPQSLNLSIPHVFLIDAQGIIANDFVYGPLTKEFFEGKGLFAEIDRLLAKKK
jgi:peroxiredoxin